MFKWLLLAGVVVGVAGFVIIQRGAVKVTYVNGLPLYNQLPNQEYIFQRDCYIFKLEHRDTSYPLVGTHAVVPELPPTVAREHIGQTVNGARILEIARLGDRFRIISVRREESRKETFVTFEILFVDEAERRYPRLDAYFLLQHPAAGEERAPEIRETFAVRRVKG
jgi:hypothetical protein